MNAISESGKEYIYILELHQGITDDNIRDNEPALKIATLANSEHINWEFILAQGFMPLVKFSPSILRSTIKDYVFTSEFWFCDCESDWLRVKHFVCPECGGTVIKHLTENTEVKTTSKLWGNGPFPSVELMVLEGLKRGMQKDKKALPAAKVLYQHLKAFDFKWTDAFMIGNF